MRILKGSVLFLAGFAMAAVLFVSTGNVPSAEADSYACIRQDLDAQGMTGNIPDPAFTITYRVPSCYKDNGYTVTRVYMYGSDVAVRYEKQQ